MPRGRGTVFCHTPEAHVASMPPPLPQHPSVSLPKPVADVWACRTLSRARPRQRRLRKMPRGRGTAFCHTREARVVSMPSLLPQYPSESLSKPVEGMRACRTLSRARPRQKWAGSSSQEPRRADEKFQECGCFNKCRLAAECFEDKHVPGESGQGKHQGRCEWCSKGEVFCWKVAGELANRWQK